MFSPVLAAAFLALSGGVAAKTVENANTVFTFSQWIEDIIADPSAPHLSPEEAVAAKNTAVASTTLLTKRANCDKPWPRANANDAAGCLDYLARLGAGGIQCQLPASKSDIQMCRIGNAQVVSSRGASGDRSVNCNDIARTGGLIFDSCWRADGTVMGSEYCISDQWIQVNILGY